MFGKKLPDPFICTGYVISYKIFRHPVQYVVKFECDMYCTYVQPFMYSSVMWPIPSFGVCCRVCHAELVHFKLYCTLLTCSILWNMSLHCGKVCHVDTVHYKPYCTVLYWPIPSLGACPSIVAGSVVLALDCNLRTGRTDGTWKWSYTFNII